MKEASYYEVDDDYIHCLLCPQDCRLRDGETGKCGVRTVSGDKLYTLNYGRISSIGVDPIEKKPLYHYYPGSWIMSVGTVGCNLSCGFCQNYELSTGSSPTRYIGASNLADLASSTIQGVKPIGIAYTYSEPMVWYEYVMDAAEATKESGLKNVLVTNGEVRNDPLDDLLSVTDAINVDIKAFTQDFYSDVCSGSLKAAKNTVERSAGRAHIEITTLLIPTLNDSANEIIDLVKWVASVDDAIPLHFSRYFPRYKMNLPPTPIETLKKAYDIAKEELKYVYIGNIEDPIFSTTYCPKCKAAVVSREGMTATHVALDGDRCDNCGFEIDIVI